MHGGMNVREVAEIVVLQEGGRPMWEVDLWLWERNICARRPGGRVSTAWEPSGL